MNKYDMDRCDSLRWKGLFTQTSEDPDETHAADGLFWCQKTQQCIGPDGKIVDDYECNETRGCYRAL